VKNGLISGVIITATAALAVLCLVLWLDSPPPQIIQERVPEKDMEAWQAALASTNAEKVNLEGKFLKFDGAVVKPSGAWPRFRGANYDNISTEKANIGEPWGGKCPPVAWTIDDLGEGYAGPAVLNGRLYMLDFDEKQESDSLRCFSFNDGKEIWRRFYKSPTKRNHGMSRTVPAVTDKYIVTVGPRCHVLCVDTETGAYRWGIDMEREYNAKIPLWYTAQCPLIDNGIAVLAPCGTNVLMMGVDCDTGKVVWQTPNTHGWDMSHSSIMQMTFKGRKMYVYATIGGMVGVSADEADRGTVLWETTEWNHSVIAPSPVVFEDGRIFVTAGYGVGSAMFQLAEKGGKFSAKQVYQLDRKVFASEQHTPILYKGHLYSVLPPDAGATKQQAVCVKPDGTVAWASGPSERFGLGPFMVADDKMFILSDDGDLTVIRATPEKFEKLATAKVLTGHEAWAPMAYVDGKLLVRDTTHMVCLDIGTK
jgi:outer membrane protein assembly factor BamB